jgi:heme A synthase
MESGSARKLRLYGTVAAALVFTQSVVGALVRHLDAGMSCPDAPLCLGQVVPPLVNPLITTHFLHRVLGLLTATVVIALAIWSVRTDVPRKIRRWTTVAACLVVAQVLLGFLSVLTVLAVIPVSLHTLLAASLLVMLVHVTTAAAGLRVASPASEPAAASR